MALYSPSKVVSSEFYPYLYVSGADGYHQLGLRPSGAGYRDKHAGSTINTPITQATTGLRHTLALGEDNKVYGCGGNSKAQLGIFGGVTPDRYQPFLYLGISSVTSISGGYQGSFAIKDDGTLWAVGDDTFGDLGLNDGGTVTAWTQVGSATNWSKVAGGTQSAMGLRSDGTLWGTGRNLSSVLGLGDGNARAEFTQVGSDTDWEDIALGSYLSMAVKDGTLYSCGDNGYGQLGLGNKTDQNTFTSTGVTDVESISLGAYSAYIIKTNGTLWSCGRNHLGQLGHGDTTERTSFTQIGSDTDWFKISSGSFFNVAVKDGGDVYGWGDNSSGQYGLSATSYDVPTLIGGIPRANKNYFVELNAACSHSGVLTE